MTACILAPEGGRWRGRCCAETASSALFASLRLGAIVPTIEALREKQTRPSSSTSRSDSCQISGDARSSRTSAPEEIAQQALMGFTIGYSACRQMTVPFDEVPWHICQMDLCSEFAFRVFLVREWLVGEVHVC